MSALGVTLGTLASTAGGNSFVDSSAGLSSEQLEKIKKLKLNEWKKTIMESVEKCNKEKMADECKVGNLIKSKTRSIVDRIQMDNYSRAKSNEILCLSKVEAKVIVMARYHMLLCKKNFKKMLNNFN